jgi:DNA repair ATPase RecN
MSEVISDPRQRKFLEHYHKTFNLPESWRAAGLKGSEGETIAQSAAKLLSTASARQYLLQLSAAATAPQDEEAEGAAVIQELKHIALSKITDICSWDSNGNVSFKPSSSIEDCVTSAIETLRIETTQFGPKIMVKMHSKQSALTTLARYYNVDIDLNSLLDRVRSYDYEPIDMSGEDNNEL